MVKSPRDALDLNGAALFHKIGELPRGAAFSRVFDCADRADRCAGLNLLRTAAGWGSHSIVDWIADRIEDCGFSRMESNQFAFRNPQSQSQSSIQIPIERPRMRGRSSSKSELSLERRSVLLKKATGRARSCRSSLRNPEEQQARSPTAVFSRTSRAHPCGHRQKHIAASCCGPKYGADGHRCDLPSQRIHAYHPADLVFEPADDSSELLGKQRFKMKTVVRFVKVAHRYLYDLAERPRPARA